MPEGYLDELLYVDEIRLDDYMRRLKINTDIAEKTKRIEAEFSLTGPKVAFAQDETRRKLDVHARITKFEEQLLSDAKLAYSRPRTPWAGIEFVREQVAAYRVLVPRDQHQAHPAVSFWLSPGDDQKGLLCLLEDCRIDDGAPFDYSKCSTYTVLASLVFFTRKQIDQSILRLVLPKQPHPNRHARIDETHPPTLFHEYYSVKDYLYEFATNPVPLLEKWGALVSPLRHVRCLYRAREYGPEAAHGWQKVTTFAYPIYVYAAPTQ